VIDTLQTSANLLLAFSTYAVGSASPGPSNLAIMATAMNAGRRSALTLALGIVSGSVSWGLLAAFGLSAVLATYSRALVALKILGGLYLLWLASRSARAAWAGASLPNQHAAAPRTSALRTYLRGAGIHLTNPKAILLWLSIVSLALPAGARTRDALFIVLGCATLALGVFCGYAVAFSTPSARRIYSSLRRGLEGTLAVLFAYAGIRVLTSVR